MARPNALLAAFTAGAVAGGIILGVVGRLATALLAASSERPANLSVTGLIEVLALGTVLGALGGGLLPLLRNRRQLSGPAPGLLVGVVLFLVMLFAAAVGGRLDPNAGLSMPGTLTVVAIVCLIYGVAADGLLTSFQRRWAAREENARHGGPTGG